MTTIHHQIEAACPPERVWAVLADLEAVQHYNPTVRTAAVKGARRSGVGAERVCDLLPNGRVVERVTHWEEGREVGLEVAESDWPIRFMRWVTRIEPKGAGSLISQNLEYELKFGPLGWLLDKLVMKRKLTATLDDVFARLARHAEAVSARARAREGVR
ncbi:MAG TPA: SRPBCC family protein [Polyangia bacterium]|nr:SRPBCC family protein [Polyangia bacterium]